MVICLSCAALAKMRCAAWRPENLSNQSIDTKVMSEHPTKSKFDANVILCPDWKTITTHFDGFPERTWRRDGEGDEYLQGWIFRGHESEKYNLVPTIERASPDGDWAEAEYKILREFQSKAHMHLAITRLPSLDDKLAWLSLLQHYGAPTRLLDFTYSPYVALYFAIRRREEGKSKFVEVWAMDEAVLHERALVWCRAADKEVRKRNGIGVSGGKPSLDPARAASPLQSAKTDEERWSRLLREALDPCSIRREYFVRNGFATAANPPLQNPRLSSQQGVFVFNGAEYLSLEDSLARMMQDVGSEWYKRFRIPEAALVEVERRLFQLNIHDLSLFPDIEGLAGFVRQKVRLHW